MTSAKYSNSGGKGVQPCGAEKAAERKEKYKSGRRNRYKVVKYHGIQYERKLTS